MILVVGGIKGGTGKTTIATNLTVLRSNFGESILLVDGDEQKSASDWVDQRINLGYETLWTTIQLTGKHLHKEINKLSPSYRHVIIDVGGREVSTLRSALVISDVFLIPFRPRSYDVWTYGSIIQLISEVKEFNPSLRCIAVINQSDFTGTDNEEAFDALCEYKDIHCAPVLIGYRKTFSSASAKGLGIIEMKPIDKKAVTELEILSKLIYGIYI